MKTDKKFIAVFFFQRYKNLISALMARLKETNAKGGDNREAIEQLERERDAALQEVADQKQMLAEQNRQIALASKNRFVCRYYLRAFFPLSFFSSVSSHFFF